MGKLLMWSVKRVQRNHKGFKISSIIGMVKDFVILQTVIWKYPIGRRIGAYALVWAGAILFLASLVFCIFMTLGLIKGIVNGTIFDNPPADEWDVR